ncbi:hypothetical protein CMQ_1634 [Grosmannia clavigera kw1407]|uniref:Uncharacterized protein n=1 Tax=Grosmannia clavigera (strain kw1407 / UAMH 11150) TaxID=655863 RepID=F0XF51_GROCL|nr:uncharacterized protein CMQ_1634 [Grosmannia clavigera kw1407]EFX04706.1 hypothetical protein CMQ_1634 [Grosmannia clavigera kw1407]
MASASFLRQDGDLGHDPDLDTNRLLPTSNRRRKRHQVRVQGRLALPQQQSVDDDASGTDEEDTVETARRDRQRRGYGIGGAGNIRRPTEVTFPLSKRPGGLTPRPRSAHGLGRDGREERDERDTRDERADYGTRESRPWAWMRGLLGRRGIRAPETVP